MYVFAIYNIIIMYTWCQKYMIDPINNTRSKIYLLDIFTLID